MMLIYVTSLDSQAITFSRGSMLSSLATSTAIAVVSAVLMALSMNPSHRRSFFGRLCLKQYIAELWDTRTYAPVGSGIDASRAHLLKFSRYEASRSQCVCRTRIGLSTTRFSHHDYRPMPRHYWPPSESLKPWLEANWDTWTAERPQWFTRRFIKRISTVAPPEVLPLTALQDLAEKYAKEDRDANHPKASSVDGSSEEQVVAASNRSSSGHNSSTRSVRFAHKSREELVRIENVRRRSRAVERAKQVWMWTVALAISYADVITTVVVGMEYLENGAKRAAHVTFAMVGASLGVKALIIHASGEIIRSLTIFRKMKFKILLKS